MNRISNIATKAPVIGTLLFGLLLILLLVPAAQAQPFWKELQFHKIIRGNLGEKTQIELDIVQSVQGVVKSEADFDRQKKTYEMLMDLRNGKIEKALQEAEENASNPEDKASAKQLVGILANDRHALDEEIKRIEDGSKFIWGSMIVGPEQKKLMFSGIRLLPDDVSLQVVTAKGRVATLDLHFSDEKEIKGVWVSEETGEKVDFHGTVEDATTPLPSSDIPKAVQGNYPVKYHTVNGQKTLVESIQVIVRYYGLGQDFEAAKRQHMLSIFPVKGQARAVHADGRIIADYGQAAEFEDLVIAIQDSVDKDCLAPVDTQECLKTVWDAYQSHSPITIAGSGDLVAPKGGKPMWMFESLAQCEKGISQNTDAGFPAERELSIENVTLHIRKLLFPPKPVDLEVATRQNSLDITPSRGDAQVSLANGCLMADFGKAKGFERISYPFRDLANNECTQIILEAIKNNAPFNIQASGSIVDFDNKRYLQIKTVSQCKQE